MFHIFGKTYYSSTPEPSGNPVVLFLTAGELETVDKGGLRAEGVADPQTLADREAERRAEGGLALAARRVGSGFAQEIADVPRLANGREIPGDIRLRGSTKSLPQAHHRLSPRSLSGCGGGGRGGLGGSGAGQCVRAAAVGCPHAGGGGGA